MKKIFKVLENTNQTSVLRWMNKLILKQLGVYNIRLIITYKGNLKDYDNSNEKNIVLLNSMEDLCCYKYPNRLKNNETRLWFDKGSCVYCYVMENEVVGYIWNHYNYDPHEDLVEISLGDYIRTGPSFVLKNQRGKGIAKALIRKVIKDNANENVTLCSAISYDNISSILYNVKNGYRIHRIVYRTKRGNIIF